VTASGRARQPGIKRLRCFTGKRMKIKALLAARVGSVPKNQHRLTEQDGAMAST
jgi:hypothetical protein